MPFDYFLPDLAQQYLRGFSAVRFIVSSGLGRLGHVWILGSVLQLGCPAGCSVFCSVFLTIIQAPHGSATFGFWTSSTYPATIACPTWFSPFITYGHKSSLCPYRPQMKQISHNPSHFIFQILPLSRNLDSNGFESSISKHSLVYWPLSTVAVVLSIFTTLAIFFPILCRRKCLLKCSTLNLGIWTQAIRCVIHHLRGQNSVPILESPSNYLLASMVHLS